MFLDPIHSMVCIGAAHWDIRARAACQMQPGSDVAGEIMRCPGGVALNIAMALARYGLRPALLSSVGKDADGNELLAQCQKVGICTDNVHRSEQLPTDRCLIIEDVDRMVATVADVRSLEAADDRILQPLLDGTLGGAETPFSGIAVIDGNLAEGILKSLATNTVWSTADLRVVSASPAKAARLQALLAAQNATIYVNLAEANALCRHHYDRSEQAAKAMRALGPARVIITDGDRLATDSKSDGTVSAMPPQVKLAQVTGAGDTFVAAHVAAETEGADRETALDAALQAAAEHVAGTSPQ